MPSVNSRSFETSLSDPPTADEVEVSIFGPGKGESILVHCGQGEWILVDSCVDSRDGSLPAIEYLRRIGTDPASAVALVVATHAHDDHIAGIARAFDACESARFVSSSAIVSEEFFALLEQDKFEAAQLRPSILNEYREVLRIVKSRGTAEGMKPHKRAIEQLSLMTLKGTPGGDAAKILALSPSDVAVTRALTVLARNAAAAGDDKRVVSADPNEMAVAIAVSVGGHEILLGADLLKGPRGCGWTAVLSTHSPARKAAVFKVPHHGAPNADHPEVWERLLEEDPLCLIAPYRAGSPRRPDRDDRRRILDLTRNAFVTAKPDAIRRTRTARRAERALGPLPRNVRDVWGIPGHVRARSVAGSSQWSVEMVDPAEALRVR